MHVELLNGLRSIPLPEELDMDGSLLETARAVSERIVRKNLSEKGLAASIDNYPQVWTRDTVVTFLGATATCDPAMLDIFRNSLEMLGERQDRFGQIPNLIRLADDTITYGSCDPTIWWVIGCCLYAERAGQPDWLSERAPAIVKALDWCEMRDFSKIGLICSMEADDWADHLCYRGYVLFANSLLVWALHSAMKSFEASHPTEATYWGTRSKQAVHKMREMFWVSPLHSFQDNSHTQVRAQMSIRLRELPFFVPWINHFEFGERFDVPGNLMAILSGVATAEQSASILNYIRQEGLDLPYPIHVLHPVISPGERDWREYYMVWGHGMPYHYQNGGIWPWVGGLYVAALVYAGKKEKAREQLVSLAKALKQGRTEEDWECNEWLHGQTGQAMGAKYQAWSAGMFLYADHCVKTGETPGFDPK